MSLIINPFVFGGAAGPTDPSTISDLQLWLHPRSFALSGGDPISTWADSSGNGRNATSSGTNRPTYRASGGSNNQPYAEFDGTTDQLDLPDFLTSYTAGHIFIVVKVANDPPSSNVGPAVGEWSYLGGNQSHYPYSDGVIYDNWATSVRKTVGNPTPSLASWRVYEILSKSGNWTAWLDGTQIFNTGTNTVQFGTTPKIAVNSGLSRMEGNMHEIIFFSRDINSTEIATVKTYLAYWYALTIA
jgi:hypothetical protein